MTENQPAGNVLEQGIEAAKAHDYAAARRFLEQAVEKDQHDEKAWFWLAAVVDDIDEKRICLNNVLIINPENARARSLLDKLEQRSRLTTKADTTAAGPVDLIGSKRFMYLAVLGAFIVVMLTIVLVIMLSGKDEKTQDSAPVVSGAVTPTSESGGQPASLPTATAISLVTPSPRPATWTPAPTVTLGADVPPTLFPGPPDTLPGAIIMESGDVPGDPRNHPIVLSRANGSESHVVTANSRGHAAVLSPDGGEIAYIEFISGTREEILTLDNIQGTAPRLASSFWRSTIALFQQDTPAWSPDGDWIAFTAAGMGAVLPDLYRVRITAAGGQDALEKLTDDAVTESWPAYSPDSRRIVYVADSSTLQSGQSVDLRIYDLANDAVTDLTTNGDQILESAPDWSPGGQYIVFGGREAGSTDSDIYRVSATGSGEPEKIMDSDYDDIRPRYSPDGRYIAFSSNRTGNWDVFIYDIANDTLYQFTTSAETDIANDWGR